nr:unnamed protein product [Leishmania braziliensis]
MMMQSPPPYVPFVEYVLKALEHPPYMYVAKLAACCTMLFLTRENPELLEELCHKWAIRFAQDRLRLVQHIRKRASYCINSPDTTCDFGCDAKDSSEEASDNRCATHPPEQPIRDRDVATVMCCCDPDKAVEHLLSILNTLVPMYFSWNWHRADYVIQINREYEVYVREYVLPLCVDLAPEEGVDDSEHTPWLLPPHTYLDPTESVSSFYTLHSGVVPSPCVGSSRSSSFVVSSPLGTVAGTDLNRDHIVSTSDSSTAKGSDVGKFSFPSLPQDVTAASTAKGKRSVSIVGPLLPTFSPTSGKTAADDGASTLSQNAFPVGVQACSSALGGAVVPIRSPNVMSARAFNAAAVYGLRFLTLSNYRDALLSNTTGLVIVFHAKYSAKSNEVIDVFQKIAAKRLLDPMPTIAVVYAVAEPELSSLYNVGWFPTIVYTPPLRYQNRRHHSPSAGLHTRTDDAVEEKTCNVSADSKRDGIAGTPAFGAGTSSTSLVPKGLVKGSARFTRTPSSPYLRPDLCVEDTSSRREAESPPRRSYSPHVDSASLPKCRHGEATARRTTGRSDGEAYTTVGAARTEVLTPSPRGSNTGSSRSLPIRNHSEVYESVGAFAATSGEQPSTSGGNPADVSSPFRQALNTGMGGAPPTSAEILFSTLVGKRAQGHSIAALSQLSTTNLENSGVHSTSVKEKVQPLGEHSGKMSLDSLKDTLVSSDYIIYPLDGVQTVSALVEWISSRGASVPRLRKMNEFFTRIKYIRQEEKFKRYRELHSAVVTLRRLQGCKNEFGVAGSAGKCSKHTPSPLTLAPQQQQHHLLDQPVFIFLGGGMAAGKTTAVAALAKSSWWESHKEQSVVVNADEFKLPFESEMSSSQAHTHSTRAAENLLVKAINQGRSIVLDATMMWKPFVQQVVAMVRDAHLTLFKQGPGYNKETQIEEYFVAAKARNPALPMPYKIIFLGITVEVETAVPRGFLRKFQTNRGVPISTQLRSFKLFAENFTNYVSLVDEATLYNNNVFVKLEKGELPPVLAECNERTQYKLLVHDEQAFQQFLRQQQINDEADNVLELYPTTPATR